MKLINMGLTGNRLVSFCKLVQQSLSRLLNKTQRNSIGEQSLDGLVIDWHLTEYDYSELPIGDSQPSYAYAA
tara:strand:+ start:658 stop:873 length:216 start_codon:yes stop_codon:yes gene_type:complete